jgi:HSP20 family protein
MPRNPNDPHEKLQRQVERLFHEMVYHWHPSSHFAETTWAPPADLVLTEHGARVLLELAGVPREKVQVSLKGRTLEVSGRRLPPPEVSGSHYHRAEIFFGEFRRVVDLPWEADGERVTATFRDGMLEILLVPAPQSAPATVTIHEEGAR